LPIPGQQVVMTIVEIPPGAREIRHTHPGMLTGYIVEGTMTLEHEGRPSATYKAGESFFVDAGKIHQGINTGTATVKLIGTLIAEKGKPLNTAAQ
jgi:quercetin dioxygenase-like cupin family protein